jgi:exoribonuclease R
MVMAASRTTTTRRRRRRRKRHLFSSEWSLPSFGGLFLLSLVVVVILCTLTTRITITEGFLLQQQQQPQRNSRQSTLPASLLHATKLKKRLEQQQQQSDTDTVIWFPTDLIDDDVDENDIDFDDDIDLERLQELAINYTASLIRPIISDDDRTTTTTTLITSATKADHDENHGDDDNAEEENTVASSPAPHQQLPPMDAVTYARGRFLDLCGTTHGETALENLFQQPQAQQQYAASVAADKQQQDAAASLSSSPLSIIVIVKASVLILQRLCVLGMFYGLTMGPLAVEQSTRHMTEPEDDDDAENDFHHQWTSDSARRLKYRALRDDATMKLLPAVQLLAALQKKQSSLGAFDLLVRLGAWQRHENLALLRSGLPVRFSQDEEDAAVQVAAAAATMSTTTTHDPDELLGIRQDLRQRFKVFTIDGADTNEIDDGLSVERLHDGDGDNRVRYWIHIADADRWAPRGSELFQVGRKRATSIYLPDKAIAMLPSSVSTDVMSLKANTDSSYAISLGVELDDKGNVIEDSLIVTPSTVRVTYRLTYDQVDEMLEDGIAYQEEWELGQLYAAAKTRKQWRFQNGNTERFLPTPIPRYFMSVYPNERAPDGLGIKVRVELGNNSGKNQSSTVAEDTSSTTYSETEEQPVSAANTLVTEMMILAGEAIGKWAQRENRTLTSENPNTLQLPFRSQDPPDYKSRSREKKIMKDLLEYNLGGGYCHAWYSRRFLSPVRVTEIPDPHSGLGLPCYVQWTSPIRRFQDLQVHTVVKRYLRRKRVVEMLQDGQAIPDGITVDDLGCAIVNNDDDGTAAAAASLNLDELDSDIDYRDRTKLLGPVQFVQKNSQKYWMLEYLRRLQEADPATEFEVLVLGCVNPTKRQYAIYVYGLGLEWRYSSPVGLQAGNKFKVRIGNVAPHNGQLIFVRMQ